MLNKLITQNTEKHFFYKKSRILEFQRFHKEQRLMVCGFVINFKKNNHFRTKAENFVFMSTFYKVAP